jgi:hypothetical protein
MTPYSLSRDPEVRSRLVARTYVRRGLAQSCFLVALAGSTFMPKRSLAAESTLPPDVVPARFFAVPLVAGDPRKPPPKFADRYGVPFIDEALPLKSVGTARVEVNGSARRIFLLGMTDSATSHSWFDPRDYSVRFFVGDELGRIRLEYADGSTQVFPLILGESVWWGLSFYKCPEPIVSDPPLRAAFATALRLYPAAPVSDGKYVAVIKPKPGTIRSLIVENSRSKTGGVVINGITVESTELNPPAGTIAVRAKAFQPEFAAFAEERTLRPLGENDRPAQERMEAFRRAFYLHEENFQEHVSPRLPRGYSGPLVSFKGSVSAEILTNAFSANVQDMVAKIGDEGMYHTSTAGAPFCWAANQYGTFSLDVGRYYFDSWTRDLGRSLQQLTELGYTAEALRCADYSLRAARLWEIDPTIKIKEVSLPRHWGRIANRPDKTTAFENDGHGLTTLFLFQLWRRLPDRDAWLRDRWTDIEATGDWILWQFNHPEISGATDVLHTTGECAAMDGYSVYADELSLDALQALAQMADSIGKNSSAQRWRERAQKMRQAIGSHYIITDPKYGRVWTLADAGWPHLSTVLGPLISRADCDGFAPEDDSAGWHAANAAAYQRLVDTYQPAGFYGQAMGYGQGFVTQSALLLDRMHEATKMLDWAAREIYDPRSGSFVVPEGVQIDPTGKYWFHIGDLGNGVQEAEMVKALRLMIGVDDTRPARLQFYPRLPYGWTEMSVEKYPVLFERAGRTETARLNYRLVRSAEAMNLEITADKDLGPVAMRLGPIQTRPESASVLLNGTKRAAAAEQSGDSWWLKLTAPVGRPQVK